MSQINQLQPISTDLFFKIKILKTMMYCGVLWGLYNEGWAMTKDAEDCYFLFGSMVYKHINTQKNIGPITYLNALPPKILKTHYFLH